MSSSPTSSSSIETAPAADVQDVFPFLPLGEVTCHVTGQLGTGSLSVRECLALKRQSIIRLDASAGEDLLILVNGVPIVRAEVVIIDNTTAFRVTDVLPAGEAS